MSDIQEVTLSVLDVSCQHCVHAIDTALGGLTGVEQVSTDLPTKTVHLRYHSNQISLREIETALDDVGYTVAK